MTNPTDIPLVDSPLKSKTPTSPVPDAKRTKFSNTALSLFQKNIGARSDSSNQWIIDVFPNMTTILMYIMLTAIEHANEPGFRDHSKTSVATLCMYYLSVVYGYFLLSDTLVRQTPSAHARNWKETSWKSEFSDFLLTLPVPEFLIPILSQFHPLTTDRTKNVFFTPSAAGYDHDVFFGRVFPINMFAAIHDCAATLPGNSTRIQVLQELYSRVLYSITLPRFDGLIPDLIGVTIDQTNNTTVNYMNSKLYQVFNSVFNPVLFRDLQRRTSLAALSFLSPTYATNHINAYDYMFAASAANLRELKVVLQSLAVVLAPKDIFRGTLHDMVHADTGASIIKHGYSTFALPTWSHSENDNKSTLFNRITTNTLVSNEDRAQDISFLQRPTAAFPAPTAVVDVDYVATAAPTQAVALPQNHRIVRHYPYSLRLNDNNPNPFPRHDNNDLVAFDDSMHSHPHVLVLDTDGDLTVTAYQPLLAGKLIETFEIDGSTIEMPNAAKPLGNQNCLFADSAISYSSVIPGSFFRPRAALTILPPLARNTDNTSTRLAASSLLFNRTRVMLPNLNHNVVDAPLPANIPGLHHLNGANYLRYVQSFLGFRTVDRTSNEANLDAVPSMPANRLYVWSPYTYNPFESDDLPLPDLSASRHYFLTNLRTFFGTDFNLVQTKHPFEAMPVV